MKYPVPHSDPGFINSVIHSLTGAQILYYLFHTWEQDSGRSVIIWCDKGEAVAKMNAIRVALAKERGARGQQRTFELKFSEPWPYTHMGIKGEAIKVERVGGNMQTRMRAAFVTLAQKGKNND